VKLEPENFLHKYESLEVKFIPGHNPDLVVYDGEVEKERIDLTKIKGNSGPEIADIEALLASKGFRRKGEEQPSPSSTPSSAPETAGCEDQVLGCEVWAKKGECEKNPLYMKKTCPKSCGTCPDTAGTSKDEV